MNVIINENERFIHATIWEQTGSGRVLIIAPAIGVSRHFYRKFAEYFSNLNYSVITFDYPGMGQMGNASKEISHHLMDWGKKDIRSIINFCKRRYVGQQLYFVGHSIAGQLFPLADNCNAISSACFIASQNASNTNWEGIHRWKALLFWNFIIPVFVRLTGKLPGYAYGGKYDINPSIADDWAKWGRSQFGLVEVIENAQLAYDRVKVPVKFFSIDQDHMLAPYKSVEKLFHQYGCSAKEMEHIMPKTYGLNHMDHFDFFRSEYSFLWPKIETWFQRTVIGRTPVNGRIIDFMI